MKKIMLTTSLSLLAAALSLAGDENDDLMKRMGFSSKEIAATEQTRVATIKALDAVGSKAERLPATSDAAGRAQAILDLRTVRQIRYQAIQASKAAEQEAQAAAARAQTAAELAQKAQNAVYSAATSNANSYVFAQMLSRRDELLVAAQAAKEEAEQKSRDAVDIAEQSQKIVGKADAQEALLKSKGIDE